MKSTSLCLSISSVWKFVIRNEISYPFSLISFSISIEFSLYLHGLSPQYEERFRPLCQKSGELVHQNVFNLVGLLNFDANPDTIDARFYQNFLVLVSRNCQRVEEDFWRACCFNLGYIMALGCLRSKV